MDADQGGVTHRQVQTRSPQAPVRRQHVPLPEDNGSNGVQSDSSLAALATCHQQHGQTHRCRWMTPHSCPLPREKHRWPINNVFRLK